MQDKKWQQKKTTKLNPSEQIRHQQQSKTERNEITNQKIWGLENRKQWSKNKQTKIPLKSIHPSHYHHYQKKVSHKNRLQI